MLAVGGLRAPDGDALLLAVLDESFDVEAFALPRGRLAIS